MDGGGLITATPPPQSLYPTPPSPDTKVPELSAVAFERDAPAEKIQRSVAPDSQRQFHDKLWLALFLLGSAAALGTGTVHMRKVRADAANAKACPEFVDEFRARAVVTQHVQDHLSQAAAAEVPGVDTTDFLLCAAALAGLAYAVGTLFLFALEREARLITWGAVLSAPAALVVTAVLLLGPLASSDNSTTTAYVLLGLAALISLVIVCKRAQLRLTAELLKMSAEAAKENRALLYTIGLTSAGFACLIVPLAGLTVYASYPQKVGGALAGCAGCFPLSNNTLEMLMQACPGDRAASMERLSSSTWEPQLLLLLGVMMLWAHFLSMEVRVANVGATIGLHYFEQPVPGSRSVQAVKWALGKSIGSLCLASLVMTGVALIAKAVQAVREKAQDSTGAGHRAQKAVMCCVDCVWRCIQQYVEQLTKMSVISLAITGEPFCHSARRTQRLLWRNNLDGIALDNFATFILALFAAVVALGLALVAYALSPPSLRLGLGALSGLFAFAVCAVQAGLVLSISNTHYMCYIIDLDHSTAHSERTRHIHELYARATSHRIAALKSSGGWAATGPGQREAANAQGGGGGSTV